jgi:hypothetical protein
MTPPLTSLCRVIVTVSQIIGVSSNLAALSSLAQLYTVCLILVPRWWSYNEGFGVFPTMDSSGEWPGFPKDTSRLPRSYEQER